MTPGEVAAILVRLENLHEDVQEIKEQTIRTNGRVTALERVNIARDAATAAVERVGAQRTERRRWMPSAGVSLLIFAGGIAAERLL